MSKKSNANVGELMAELEAIVQWFESADIDLNEGLAKFERGSEIVKELKNNLDDVENKVEKIQKSFEQSA